MTLHLLPNLLADDQDHTLFLPPSVDAAVSKLDGLIAESSGGGRRYLKRFQTKLPPHHMPIALMQDPVDFLLEPVLQGQDWGLVSDAGLPCLADPGSLVVRRARQLKIPIKAYSGPSSITMALMLSGLPAQRFSFHGYLSKHPKERAEQLVQLEKIAKEEKSTQIFIEAPYRNQHTFEACLSTLKPSTVLSVATALTSAEEHISTQSIQQWIRSPCIIDKCPAIFLIL